MADVTTTSTPSTGPASLRARLTGGSPYVRRLRVIVVLFLVGLLLLTMRLVDLQVVRAETLATTATQFRSRTYTIPAERGEIVDSEGNVLARSRQRYNVAVNQVLIEEYVRRDEKGRVIGQGPAAAAEVLSPILDIEETKLAGMLYGSEDPAERRTWRYLAKDVSVETWRKINSYSIPGIEPESFMKREYPNDGVGLSVIGFIGDDGEGNVGGQAGIEAQYDKELSGTDGSLLVEIARSGAVIPSGRKIEEPAKDGSTIQLTIDTDLQDALDKALRDSVTRQSADWGAAVAIEVGTGRVLALSDTDSYNPAHPSEGGQIGSRAAQSPVEPGSTGKLITFSSALDQGQINPLSIYEVSSTRTMPNGETIRDNDEHATEAMTVAGILGKSYNTGLIQIGDTISDATRYDYMLKYGLGKRTGIELPSESPGILHPAEEWSNRTHYATMFGQSYALTTLQLGQVAATIGNGGVRTDLHMVDSVIEPDGTVVPTVVDDPVRVLSEEASKEMLSIMEATIDRQGTGWTASIDGYRVAGKTGTAQMADGSGGLSDRVGTFAGVLPAEDPQIAVAVVVYNGAGPGYGSETAAPVFREFGAFAARHLGIPPSSTPRTVFPWTQTELQAAQQAGQLGPNGAYVEIPEGRQ